jgi:hypothetical protein
MVDGGAKSTAEITGGVRERRMPKGGGEESVSVQSFPNVAGM